jgi:hypothetical protein
MATKNTQTSGAQKRLAKLREMRGKQKGRTGARAADTSTGGASGSDRKRKVVKALIQRRRKGGQDTEAGRGAGRRLGAGARAGGGMRGDGAAGRGGGEGLDQFPRLKAILQRRRGQGGDDNEPAVRSVDASSTPEEIAKHIEVLEKRASRLESALAKTKEEMETARKLQNAAGSNGSRG